MRCIKQQYVSEIDNKGFGQIRGHPFMMSTRKSGFRPPFLCSQETASYCGRPHTVNMNSTSLSWNSWYNDLLDLKLKFDYNIIVIYLKMCY